MAFNMHCRHGGGAAQTKGSVWIFFITRPKVVWSSLPSRDHDVGGAVAKGTMNMAKPGLACHVKADEWREALRIARDELAEHMLAPQP